MYDALGIATPLVVNGHEQMPMHGQSLAYTFGDTSRTTQRGPQYFEMMGHRAIWADGFKAVTFHDQGVPYDKDLWSLYKLDEDFRKCTTCRLLIPKTARNDCVVVERSRTIWRVAT